ncbi:hypothetical protein [Pedococcus sp. 5OH_020]|uniref:hypothetical protein n=1 Tax=Pedococcus sp. 5OH_020 TaxID=2989814 RepID=UPI0022E9DA21|nr:hypothetical protein [Pedococcus sp. 5OH_020]
MTATSSITSTEEDRALKTRHRAMAEEPDRVAALDRDLLALAERFDRGHDRTVLDWEYLLVTARRV